MQAQWRQDLRLSLATGVAATGLQHERAGGGGRTRSFEAACRLATVRSRHTAPAAAQVPHIPNYNLRYAKRSTQNINVENMERLFSSRCDFGETLKNVISEWWLKSREAPHSHPLTWVGDSQENQEQNDICSPATPCKYGTMIQNSIIIPFAFIFLYSFII